MTAAQHQAIELMKKELRTMRHAADGLADLEAVDDPHRSIDFIFEHIEAAEFDEQHENTDGELLAA